MESDNFALTVYSVVAGLPALGLLASLIIEIVLLKSTGWVDGRSSLKYPLLVFLVNVPITTVLVILNFVAFGVLGTALILVSYVLMFIASLGLAFVYAAVLFAARLAVTKMIAGSSALTWKYVAVQALALAIVIVISLPILGLLVTQSPN